MTKYSIVAILICMVAGIWYGSHYNLKIGTLAIGDNKSGAAIYGGRVTEEGLTWNGHRFQRVQYFQTYPPVWIFTGDQYRKYKY